MANPVLHRAIMSWMTEELEKGELQAKAVERKRTR